MKNKKKLIILMLQIFLIVAFIFTYQQYVEFSLQPTEVFGYSRDLDEGVKITERDLVKIPLSQMTLSLNMIKLSNKNEVVGKYTKIPVVRQSIVYKDQLGDITSVDKFASLDLSNSRVISLPIDYTYGVAGDFRRGDRLDLMYSVAGASSENGDTSTTFTYAKIFLQNISVYQINTAGGYKFIPHSDVDVYTPVVEGETESSERTYEGASSISIIVTPEQAEQIEARRLSGNIGFVKRFEESETHETLGFVIGQYGKLFAGHANAETGNVNVSDAFLGNANAETNTEPEVETDLGTGNMEIGD